MKHRVGSTFSVALILSFAFQLEAQTPARGNWHWDLGEYAETYLTVQQACRPRRISENPFSAASLAVHDRAKTSGMTIFGNFKRLQRDGLKKDSPEYNDALSKTQHYHEFNIAWENMKASTFTGFCDFQAGRRWNKAIREKVIGTEKRPGLCDPAKYTAIKKQFEALRAEMVRDPKVPEATLNEWRQHVAKQQSDMQFRSGEKRIREKVHPVDMAEFNFTILTEDKEYPWPAFLTDQQWESACGPFIRQDPAEMLKVARTLSGNPRVTISEFQIENAGGPTSAAAAIECMTSLGASLPTTIKRARFDEGSKAVTEGNFVFTKTSAYFVRTGDSTLDPDDKLDNDDEGLLVLGIAMQNRIKEAMKNEVAIPEVCKAE
ncbi:MAG: hypothetical protein ABL958_09325, partial [Bdellovibrionia bacterium]